MRPTSRRIAPLVVLTLLSGCATTRETGKPLVPTRFQTRTGPFVVFTNDPIAADAPVVRQLQALETEFGRVLDADVRKVDPPIEVYLLADRKTFEHFLTFYYPELPQRRAFFLSQGERRVIYTFVGDHVEVDVRHEATHALLSVAYGEIPLWLDEGIAEFFETPGGDGNNPENLRRFEADLAEDFTPDAARLERLRSIKEMTPRDYRESWAWCHYLLVEAPDGVALLRSTLRTPGESLADRIARDIPDARRALISHVQTLAANPAKPAATVRLQDDVEPPASRPKPKRGLLGRVRDLVFGRDSDGP